MTAPSRNDQLLSEAQRAVASFVSDHPDYRADDGQPEYRGGANRVTLGHCGQQPVVFKFFGTAERWLNELTCLRHFRSTGLVPRLLCEVPDRLIVMAKLDGQAVAAAAEAAEPPVRKAMSVHVGKALARFVDASLIGAGGYRPARDFKIIFWGDPPSQAVWSYVRIARRVQEALPIYREGVFRASLDLVESQEHVIDQDRRCLFHEDVFNTRVSPQGFAGFYDLEMCRQGTESMHLGVALGLCGKGLLRDGRG